MMDFYPDCTSQNVTVSYKATSEKYAMAYQNLISRYENVKFVPRTALKNDIIDICETTKSEYIQFFVDDNVFVRPYTHNCKEFEMFENDKNISCLSLRLAPHINFAYTSQMVNEPPVFENEYVWDWRCNKNINDWYYPMSIDGHVFRSGDILQTIKDGDYIAPNSFEQALVEACPVAGNKMICFEQSKIINIPCNKVQTENNNHAGLIHSYSADFLNEQFLNGKRIDPANIYGIINNSIHYELPIVLI
jgi:hypothetical protein